MKDTNNGCRPIFVVTVDTEADDAWSSADVIGLKNMKRIPRFQELCESFGVVPTYLVTYECASRDEAIKVLEPPSSGRRAEIGHHLHVWTAPPFERNSPDGIDRRWLNAFQFQLPQSLFEEKAETLRAKIEETFGRSPTSHRAGRLGIDQRSIDWLCRAGFTVDSSVRPLLAIPGINMPECAYHNCENPYYWSASEQPVKSQILEVPTSIHRPSKLLANFYSAFAGQENRLADIVTRIYAKCGGLLPLRPDPKTDNRTLERIIDTAVARNVRVVNLTLHSSELELSCSPFSQNSDDAEKVWSRLSTVLARVRRHNMASCGLSEVPDVLQRFA